MTAPTIETTLEAIQAIWREMGAQWDAALTARVRAHLDALVVAVRDEERERRERLVCTLLKRRHDK